MTAGPGRNQAQADNRTAGLGPFQATFYESASPIVRFVAHSLSVALGFVALTPILMIPIGVVWVLIWLGVNELGNALKVLEAVMLWGEIGFFVVTLTVGAVELLAIEVGRAWSRVRAAYA